MYDNGVITTVFGLPPELESKEENGDDGDANAGNQGVVLAPPPPEPMVCRTVFLSSALEVIVPRLTDFA